MILRIYRGVLYGLAGLSGALLVWLMISVILSVFMRNMGMQPFAWLF
ncbi:MAG: TRAP transporter small permease, partial [Paracoccaceae bacterium]